MSSSSFFEIKRRKWTEVGVNRLRARNTLYTPNWTKQLIATKQLIFPGSSRVAVLREWRLASCQLNVSPGGVLVRLLAALSWVKWSLFTNGLFSVPKSPDKAYSFDELQIKTSYPSHGAVNQIVSLFKKKGLLHVWFIILQGNCNWSMKSWYCAFLSGPKLTWPSFWFAILPCAMGWEWKYEPGHFFCAKFVNLLSSSAERKEFWAWSVRWNCCFPCVLLYQGAFETCLLFSFLSSI